MLSRRRRNCVDVLASILLDLGYDAHTAKRTARLLSFPVVRSLRCCCQACLVPGAPLLVANNPLHLNPSCSSVAPPSRPNPRPPRSFTCSPRKIHHQQQLRSSAPPPPPAAVEVSPAKSFLPALPQLRGLPPTHKPQSTLLLQLEPSSSFALAQQKEPHFDVWCYILGCSCRYAHERTGGSLQGLCLQTPYSTVAS